MSGEFYEVLREAIPIIDAAIRRLISLNGTIHIIGDNAALVRELEDFCINVPVNDMQHGIHAFLENSCNEVFEQGFAISEFVLTRDMKDISGRAWQTRSKSSSGEPLKGSPSRVPVRRYTPHRVPGHVPSRRSGDTTSHI